jgi:NADH:ubiquinone oxidoreductase subunit E
MNNEDVKKIFVCTNHRANPSQPSCAARGSKQLLLQLCNTLKEQEINITLEEIQCLGHCTNGPNMRLSPNGQFFHAVKNDDLLSIANACKAFLIKPT